MKIKSAEFIKGITGDDPILRDKIPQIAFIGRSNVGKSSVINAVTNRKNLVKSSSKAGKTKEINFFLINNSFYFVDLPGYGFAETSLEKRKSILLLIQWYLFDPNNYPQKVILITDAKIGMTEKDQDMLHDLEHAEKEVLVIANKIDKLNASEYSKNIQAMQAAAGTHIVVPFSAKNKTNINKLLAGLFLQYK